MFQKISLSFLTFLLCSFSCFASEQTSRSQLMKKDFPYLRGLLLMQGASNFFIKMEILYANGEEKQATRELRKVFHKEGYLKKDLKHFSYQDLIEIYAEHFSEAPLAEKGVVELLLDADRIYQQALNLMQLQETLKKQYRKRRYSQAIEAIEREAKILILARLIERGEVIDD